ncbi:MAG: holo-[acyl-carrier-protein] synthase [Planctomycetaceae bacterium]|nr:MAG: holo-[acyl-carrier-protein] synthase [Planctomycetaceae bacterium]
MNVFGIGTEIVECVRIAKMIERHGELFLERVYTTAEVDYCAQRGSAMQHYAARWAAKEAVVKALAGRVHGVRWNQIEIPPEGPGGAKVRLQGRAATWAAQCGVEEVRISLGSCRTHATGFAIALLGGRLP